MTKKQAGMGRLDGTRTGPPSRGRVWPEEMARRAAAEEAERAVVEQTLIAALRAKHRAERAWYAQHPSYRPPGKTRVYPVPPDQPVHEDGSLGRTGDPLWDYRNQQVQIIWKCQGHPTMGSLAYEQLLRETLAALADEDWQQAGEEEQARGGGGQRN